MATTLLRASFRRNDLGLGLGASRRIFQVQHRLQTSHSKIPTNKSSASTPVSSSVSAAAVSPLPLWERLGPLTRIAQAYGRSQRARPYVTQFWSAVVIYLCADLSAQSIGGNEYDPLRTARSMAIGGMVAIPVYRWFIFLSNHFNYASRWVTLAAKIVISQAVFTPTFNSIFFAAQAVLSGEGISGAIDRVKNCVPTTIITSAKFWPPFTAFAFTFVPMEYRSIFTGFVAVGWQTYLSFVNRRAELLEARKAELGQAKPNEVRLKEIELEVGDEAPAAA
ncbi:hypothetical protein AK830_g3590 [Neonectria ditissima]|uniref:Protein SYM1 n=1 Tax=Neonectria ditissima TaxID=78410 RepID=A0A0P7BHL8_9HYPO|nr:hypothetical protein AK830_g3590 [Neonectria ditissima]